MTATSTGRAPASPNWCEMCGVNGIVSGSGRPERQLLRRMADLVDHRGPDDKGVEIIGSAGFSHARLSIIDLEHGHQPMVSDDGAVMLTFNGEIYNHIELRAELVSAGVTFRTRSDTEVLLKSYLHWGESCVDHFNGEWAFAVWDERHQRLFASRDRLGIRPFYYAMAGRDLVFGSTIMALGLHPALHLRPDPVGLDDIFTFWVPLQSRTFFEGVSQLPPGHCLRFEGGRIDTSAYWEMDFSETNTERSEDECVEELEALLLDSIHLRLRSDVPLGVYVSGGLDSALTTALIAKYTDTSIRSFSMTFDDTEFDESIYQNEVAQYLGTEHFSVPCREGEISALFAEVVRHVEQPVLRTAPAPMYILSRLASSMGCKVVITGEGADEMFGGYDIFKEMKVRRFWGRDVESQMRPLLLKRLYPYMPALQAQSGEYLRAFFMVSDEAMTSPIFSHLPRWNLTSKLKGFYSSDLAAELRTRDAYAEIIAELPSRYGDWSEFAQAQYLESAYLLPGYILSAQGDRMLMANSVEGRFPFLDHRVAEFGMQLPTRLKMKGLSEKYLLKRLSDGLVPASICRRSKQPYRAPDVSSFFDDHGRPRDDYVTDVMSGTSIRAVGLFDPDKVAGLVRKCSRGKAIGTKDNQSFVGILSTQLLALGR